MISALPARSCCREGVIPHILVTLLESVLLEAAVYGILGPLVRLHSDFCWSSLELAGAFTGVSTAPFLSILHCFGSGLLRFS